jgi:hypothetical protein
LIGQEIVVKMLFTFFKILMKQLKNSSSNVMSSLAHNVSGIAEGMDLELQNFKYRTNAKQNY